MYVRLDQIFIGHDSMRVSGNGTLLTILSGRLEIVYSGHAEIVLNNRCIYKSGLPSSSRTMPLGAWRN